MSRSGRHTVAAIAAIGALYFALPGAGAIAEGRLLPDGAAELGAALVLGAIAVSGLKKSPRRRRRPEGDLGPWGPRPPLSQP